MKAMYKSTEVDELVFLVLANELTQRFPGFQGFLVGFSLQLNIHFPPVKTNAWLNYRYSQ